jgi:valyl-tRNA synthetase
MPWDAGDLAPSIMVARWPEPPAEWIDDRTEKQFGTFLGVVAAIREIRSRQNVPPRTKVKVAIRGPRETSDLLQPMHAAIESMATVEITAAGPEAAGAPGAATASATTAGAWDAVGVKAGRSASADANALCTCLSNCRLARSVSACSRAVACAPRKEC